MHDSIPYTRRLLLKHGLLMASAASTIPSFLNSSACAMASLFGDVTSVPGVPDERILVVLQLSGGNDGLNTVVPVGFDEYYKARTGIAIAEKDALKLSGASGIALHPALASLREMYDDKMLAIVQGVGYPNPNRSHFKSMDIWHTADTTATGDGWLGRYIDSECCGYGAGESGTAPRTIAPAIAVGRTAPLALQGRLMQPVSFESADLFRWSGSDIDRDLAHAYDAINQRTAGADSTRDTNADFLVRTALDAQVASDRIRRAVAQRPLVTYPTGGAAGDIARQLQMVGAMIRANLKTRVYYVSMGGYDTHAQQGAGAGRHANLLRGFADALRAFYADLKAQGNDSRVLTMVFSEFGRRVGQNASGGTDHGTAAPMFLVGPMVRAGVLTPHPSLKDLDAGDLKYGTDFRSVYAGLLDQWLKADSAKVLGQKHKPLALIHDRV